jgi:hypothetical protein
MAWKKLSLTPPIRSAPSILVNTHFTLTSYSVSITDLYHIWNETLIKSDILKRATSEETTIDPSEDDSQLQLLLEKLETSLLDNGGELALHSVATGTGRESGAATNSRCSLRLQLTLELPAPLPELRWTFRLKQGSTSDFTNLFVLPLISLASMQGEQIENLLTAIEAKDRVIQKLVGSFEDSKLDLGSVVGHRSKKALVPFDKDVWEDKFRGLGDRTVKDIVGVVFGNRRDVISSVRNIDPDASEWWREIDTNDDSDNPRIIKTLYENKEQRPPPPKKEQGPMDDDSETADADDDEDNDENDEFEVWLL